MKERLSVVTRKGQVTIPAEVRRSLGLKLGDRVAFLVEDSDVRLVRRGSVAQRTAGMFRTAQRAHSAAELRENAEQAISDESAERSES